MEVLGPAFQRALEKPPFVFSFERKASAGPFISSSVRRRLPVVFPGAEFPGGETCSFGSSRPTT